MTGNRNPRFRLTSISDDWRTRPHNNPILGSRRTDSAPPGVGVKTKPAARVDLRSSPDPDPLPALSAPSRETGQTGHNFLSQRG
jgi:hypothetical protein